MLLTSRGPKKKSYAVLCYSFVSKCMPKLSTVLVEKRWRSHNNNGQDISEKGNMVSVLVSYAGLPMKSGS